MSKSADPIRYVVVSYFPLLTGEAGGTININDGNLSAFMSSLEALPSGGAECCLWVDHESGPRPILVMDQADAIYDHLVAWSEGAPAEWFKLVLMRDSGKYLISLAPDVKKSIERFNTARHMNTGYPVPPDAAYNVLFRCVYFVSGSSNAFDVVRDSVSDELSVGLMDLSLLDTKNPQSMDLDKIRWVGPLRVTDGGDMTPYFKKMLDETIGDPLRGSVVFDRN